MLRHRCFLEVKSALTALTVFVCLTLAPALMAAETEESLPLKATGLFQIGKLTVTNSMLVSWIVAIAVILFAQIATRNIKSVPSGAQNFWEWMVESLYNFLESIIGRDLVKKTFWFFATIFIFILFLNWFGLIPGVGTIGWGEYAGSDGQYCARAFMANSYSILLYGSPRRNCASAGFHVVDGSVYFAYRATPTGA